MSLSKNTIRFSDITTTPIKLKYSASYASSSFTDYGITSNRGKNVVMSPSGSYPSNGLKYRVVKQLYYQNYLTGSLLLSSSFFDSSLQSTAASASNDEDYRYFPNSANSEVTYLAIPRTVFGEQVSRNTFVAASTDGTTYRIEDDGNGNLIDKNNNNLHVGNILYAQGIITLTNSSYIAAFLNNSFTFSLRIVS